MMQRAFVALIALGTVFAGCLGGSDSSGSEADHGHEEHADEAEEEGNATLLQAVILVLQDGNASEPLNGTFSLVEGVNATFDGSSSIGENISFAWDFGDGNSSVGPVVEHAFAAGAFNVTLTITRLDNETSSATVAVDVAPSGPAPGTFIRDDKKTWSGTITATAQVSGACGGNGSGHTFNHEWNIGATEADGTAVSISRFLIKLSTSNSNQNRDTDIYLYDAAGKELGKGTGATAAETIDVTGAFAPGKFTVKVLGCTAVQGPYSVDATATLVVA